MLNLQVWRGRLDAALGELVGQVGNRSGALAERDVDTTYLVAQWIHFTFFGIILPTIKLKVYTFWGL